MRKNIFFFIAIMLISFVTPNLFLIDVFSFKTEKNIQNEEKNITDMGKIKLLLTESGEIIELDFDEYIKGVLIGEVPITYEIEALKAQAIVARTYTLYKLKNNKGLHENADMCDDINCCQCYKTKEYAFLSWDDNIENQNWNKLELAVNETRNKYITYSGEIISAFFHANSGGQTENVKYVWGGEEIPYLQSVKGNEVDIYQDVKKFTRAEFAELIKEKIADYDSKDYEITIINYTGSGRVNNLKIGEVELKATELRKLIGLRSTNFRIEKSEEGEISFYTIGYGHGVGLSQEGANQMAKDGATFEEIVKHYYKDVEIEEL